MRATSLPARLNFLAKIVMELTSYGVAFFLALSGGAKILGVTEMVNLYATVGLGLWFRYVSGAVELVAAVLLVLPGRRLAGVGLAAVIMVVGVVEHTFASGRLPGLPAVLIGAALILLLIRHWPEGTSHTPGR